MRAESSSAVAGSSEKTLGSSSASSPSGSAARSPAAAASSMMTCAFVPLIPKEETPARRGSVAVQSRSCVSSRSGTESQSTSSVGCSLCSVRGSTPWRIAITILITPPTPAAATLWPMFDFSEPSHSGRSRPAP